MRRFIKHTIIFMLPVLLMGTTIEALIRHIPNDYAYKREYLDKNADDIEILFLGSSHAYYCINPAYIQANSFNAAYISQSLYYDYRILEKYENNWDHLKYIVISVSYFSLFTKFEASAESWRVKNYSIYYDMKTTNNITDYSELLSNKFSINLGRIYDYYWTRQNDSTSSELGWGQNFSSDVKLDLNERGKIAAKRHTKPNHVFYNENLDILEAIISFAEKHHALVVFYTPPAYKTYVAELDEEQLTLTVKTMDDLDHHYKNVVYKNFLTDESFLQDDFYDADHLNELGAERFTKKIQELIDQINSTILY